MTTRKRRTRCKLCGQLTDRPAWHGPLTCPEEPPVSVVYEARNVLLDADSEDDSRRLLSIIGDALDVLAPGADR